jgi:ABC-2 type transport system permease protein
MTIALMRRSLTDVVRIPAESVPAAFAPAILVLGVTAMFGKLAVVPGFGTSSFITFLVPFGMLQAAASAGGATGVNLARDIEQGAFDRLLASPVSRGAILAAPILSTAARVMIPVAVLLVASLGFGATFPGIDGLAVAVLMCVGFALAAAAWASLVALTTRTQSAAPLMHAPLILAVLLTTAYAPEELLAGWLQDVASWNPVTAVLRATRQGFISDVTWASTWPGLVTVAVLLTILFLACLRRLNDTAK